MIFFHCASKVVQSFYVPISGMTLSAYTLFLRVEMRLYRDDPLPISFGNGRRDSLHQYRL